jgi:toxin ParE1/3/4
MMQLAWTRQAIREREAIVDYIALANEMAALNLDIRIEKALERLMVFPDSGRKGRISQTRELVISGTPYIAAYQVTDNIVLILTIRHGTRIWPARL